HRGALPGRREHVYRFFDAESYRDDGPIRKSDGRSAMIDPSSLRGGATGMQQPRSGDDEGMRRVDPFLVSVLKSRFEAIVREMTLVVMKASRSAVIKNAKDLSCAILTYDHRLVSTEEALPIHVMSMDKATRPITELFADIKQ